ncbi:hypothetical protein [Pelagibius marinus]|uniref:hypothetical protein n=1 Tax=Pelagibius marinus TaxID=2762760 RepID=UPI00187230DA|nr:hypothetical protein [Pelagibius marinus]
MAGPLHGPPKQRCLAAVRFWPVSGRREGTGLEAGNAASRGITMIYFFAGPHRNGSHFQYFVAEEALKQIGRPYQVLDPVPFHNHDLAASKRILRAAAKDNATFLAKGHWYRKRELDLLQSCPNLRVMVIWRDIPSAMMSAYKYYYAKKGYEVPSFDEFYWKGAGRWMLIEQYRYRLAYRCYDAFQSSYEGLVDDFDVEAARLINAMGIGAEVDLAKLAEAVSKPRLRETHGDRDAVFFTRSGPDAAQGARLSQTCLSDFRKVGAMSAARLAAESWIEAARQAPRYLAHRLSNRLLVPN